MVKSLVNHRSSSKSWDQEAHPGVQALGLGVPLSDALEMFLSQAALLCDPLILFCKSTT